MTCGAQVGGIHAILKCPHGWGGGASGCVCGAGRGGRGMEFFFDLNILSEISITGRCK